jgi:hypothetical protein
LVDVYVIKLKIKMKKLLFIASLIACFNVFSQTAIENIESSHVLFLGYENKFIVGSSEKIDSLVVDNGIIQSAIFSGQSGFIIRPAKRENCTLYGLRYNSNSIDTVYSKTFLVKPLSPPALFWGDVQSGENADLNANQLSLRYPFNVALLSTFQVKSWEAVLKGKVYHGKGDLLTQEFLENAKSLSSGETINFITTVLFPDGMVRKIEGVWKR